MDIGKELPAIHIKEDEPAIPLPKEWPIGPVGIPVETWPVKIKEPEKVS